MTLKELLEACTKAVAEGHGDLPVFAAQDDEGNGFHSVHEFEVRPFTDEYLEEYGWADEDLPEQDVLILW